MKIVFLLEEYSMRAALEVIIPRLIPDMDFQCITHEGKQDLEKFRNIPELFSFFGKAEVSGTSVIIHSADIKQAESAVITALAKEKLLPMKLELLEPSLESLFLEVVK